MIYDNFSNLKDGNYYFCKKPYMDGYDMFDADNHISNQVSLRKGVIIGTNRRTGDKMSATARDMDNGYVASIGVSQSIIGDTVEEVAKERAKVIFRLKSELEDYFGSVLNKINDNLKKTNYYEILEKNPEVMV